jgi:hypothetical protein
VIEENDSSSKAIVIVVRMHLPWFLLDLGVADEGPDCERVGGTQAWYNHDGENSACNHCKVVRPGHLWEEHSHI